MKTKNIYFSTLLSGFALGGSFLGCAAETVESESTEQALSYGPSAAPIPGRFQAEDFDLDGPAVAYNDTTPGTDYF
jgi:hypothetical protein